MWRLFECHPKAIAKALLDKGILTSDDLSRAYSSVVKEERDKEKRLQDKDKPQTLFQELSSYFYY